ASRCGGCDFMHASETLQHALHHDAVRDLLARHGIAATPTLVPVGARLGYRDRARLAVRARGRHVDVGYRVRRGQALVALEACPVLGASLQRVFGDLTRALAGSRGDGEALVARGAGDRPVVELTFRGELAGDVFGTIA